MRSALLFGDYAFDREARSLSRAGHAIDLSPKAFALLAALLEVRPRALSKAELHDLLWPGTCVSHYSLPRVVAEVRRSLGDRRRPARFVRTVHAFGYAFCGEVRDPEGSPPAVAPGTARFALFWQARAFPLSPGETLIGRDPDCAVRIDLPLVSRRHARVEVAGGAATIEDLGSKNGTSMAGKRVLRPTRMVDGAEIVLASEVLTFRDFGGLRSTRTAPKAD